MGARENKCQISQNDILPMKFSEFYQFLQFLRNLEFIVSLNIRTQKQFPLSVFVYLLTLWLSLLHKTRVTMRFPGEISSSCIWVAIPVDWASLHWYACSVDGRSVGRTVTWLPKFFRMGRLTHFLRYGATLSRASCGRAIFSRYFLADRSSSTL